MKITKIETKPLRIPYKEPFHWARGVIDAAEVVLVEVHTDEGITGYGESMSSASAESVQRMLHEAARVCVGQSAYEISSLVSRAYKYLFAARGNCSAPRFGALVLAGLDMALWDAVGKATGRAVHDLLGGAVRDRIAYFGFPQGATAEQVAGEAAEWAARGCEVIYIKIGRGEALDLNIVAKVRAAIGKTRLRLDANEAWDVLTANRMIKALAPFDIEFVEQPTSSDSLSALAQVKAMSSISIAADQAVFTPEDVYQACRQGAADLVVLGLHETGTIRRFLKAASIAEAAGINVCLHGLYETGITSCAHNQIGAVIENLDDGNQYMNHFLKEDIISEPNLVLSSGQLPIVAGPGLGFSLDWDAVGRAQEAYRNSARM